jgi:Phosphate-selective porin O and P
MAVYAHPSGKPEEARADLRRIVLGVGHEFDERTRMAIEMEWEHAVTSKDDAGEAAIEQAYVERDIGRGMHLRAGLFLIPLGLLNEQHEPPTFYGVDRNLVETAIIPTTWREGGAALSGNSVNGFGWSAGVTTGFDLNKWDAASTEGSESPLGSVHQEMQLAKAGDLSFFGAMKYTGVPGFAAGAGVFTGKAGQQQIDSPSIDSSVTLWSAYAQWEPAAWQLRALYAHGQISNTRAINLSFTDPVTFVPAAFWGGYAELAYRGFGRGGWSLEPFLRYERLNTGASYADLGVAGLTPSARPTQTVSTLGATFRMHPNVVFKFDYQDFRNDVEGSRINVGLGYLY